MSKEHKWMRLDNAALIYPASRSRKWMAMFRLSALLTEDVDPALLSAALRQTLHRFPSFAQRLRKGFFWNYLEHIDGIPDVQEDVRNPCVPMNFKESGHFMLRVRYYKNRIAVEFFHVLTDGTGGLCFLKTLVAEYLTLRYHIIIPRGGDLFDCSEEPKPGELEDSFAKNAGSFGRSRSEASAYCIEGTPEKEFMHITTGIMEAGEVLALAKRYKATLTELLTSLLILSGDKIQQKYHPNRAAHKPVKISVPVNLRKYYGSNTVRNFASYINPGIEPKYGVYSLPEVVKIVSGYMAVESNEKLVKAKFSTNVMSQKNIFLRLAPLFLKTRAMRLVFHFKGDRQTTSTISNLGVTELPAEMRPYVTRLDFMLGPLSRNRVSCACLSYDGKLVVNFTRTIEESDFEKHFFTSLVKLGIHVKIESNNLKTGREESCPTA